MKTVSTNQQPLLTESFRYISLLGHSSSFLLVQLKLYQFLWFSAKKSLFQLTLFQYFLANLEWYVRSLDSEFWWDFNNLFSKYNFAFAVSVFAFFFNPKRCLLGCSIIITQVHGLICPTRYEIFSRFPATVRDQSVQIRGSLVKI